MRITFVKKILKDGSPCGKCADVDNRLNESGHMAHIDHVAIADERDFNSEGMKLARRHAVKLAPFFIVEDDSDDVQIYTVYFKLVKEVLSRL